MNEATENLIEALREELKQYGEMLLLLEQQQEWIFQRQSQDVLQSADAVNAQNAALVAVRRAREQYQRNLAKSMGAAEDASLAVLIPRTPSHFQALLKALVEENNDLVRRIQHRARQNHLLLSRTVDLLQRFVSALFPSIGATTYNGNASLVSSTPYAHSAYEAVG